MPDQELSEYLSYLLTSANQQMRSGLTKSIGNGELTEEQWRILRLLGDEEGFSMGELAEGALMNGPALTKCIDKLVSRGLVQRAGDPTDSRRVLVFITDTGLKTMSRVGKRIDEHHASIEDGFGPAKTKQLKKLLASFVKESQSR